MRLTVPWPGPGRPAATSPTGSPSLLRERVLTSVTALSPCLSAHLLLYICTPNSGNAAAKLDRAKLFAANALAAYNGYWCARQPSSPPAPPQSPPTQSTRKVNTPEYTQMTLSPYQHNCVVIPRSADRRLPYPMPNRVEKIIGTASDQLSPSSEYERVLYLSSGPAGTRLAVLLTCALPDLRWRSTYARVRRPSEAYIANVAVSDS